MSAGAKVPGTVCQKPHVKAMCRQAAGDSRALRSLAGWLEKHQLCDWTGGTHFLRCLPHGATWRLPRSYRKESR